MPGSSPVSRPREAGEEEEVAGLQRALLVLAHILATPVSVSQEDSARV